MREKHMVLNNMTAEDVISLARQIVKIDPSVCDSIDELAEYFLMHPAEIGHFKETYKGDLE